MEPCAIGAEGIRSGQLDNGVQVLSQTMEGVASVAVGAWVRRGGAHDPAKRTGLSHFLEHMAFKGTETRSAQEIAISLESVGGSLGAYTAREHTGYEARVLSRHLPVATEVLADLVSGPVFDPRELEREKEVVIEEIAAVDDAPDDLVFDLHGDRLWRDHPYGRPILGTRETVTAISPADVANFHRDASTGGNVVVAAAGRVDQDAFRALAERWFGDLEASDGAPELDMPPAPVPGVAWAERDSAQAHLVTAWSTPGHSHPGRYALILLSEALGGGMSSRLFQRVREELALAYAVYSFQSFYTQAGVLGTYIATRPRSVAAALEAVRSLYAEFAREGLSQDELDKVKEQVKGQILLSLESPVTRVHRIAGFALLDEPFVPVSELPGLIDRVSRDDIVRAARNVLNPDRQCVLGLGPRNSGVTETFDHTFDHTG